MSDPDPRKRYVDLDSSVVLWVIAITFLVLAWRGCTFMSQYQNAHFPDPVEKVKEASP